MEDTLSFKLTTVEADLIVKSLGELPYRASAQLIANLQMQFQQQQQVNSENPLKNEVEIEKAS